MTEKYSLSLLANLTKRKEEEHESCFHFLPVNLDVFQVEDTYLYPPASQYCGQHGEPVPVAVVNKIRSDCFNQSKLHFCSDNLDMRDLWCS